MNIFIPNINFETINKKQLFIATRPFFLGSSWGNDAALKKQWNINDNFNYTNTVSLADVLFIPKPITFYKNKELKQINDLCSKHNIKGYGCINRDHGLAYKEFKNLVYFRPGGFKNQLTNKNIGIPFALSDIYKGLYTNEPIVYRNKSNTPIIGFCGHANSSVKKKITDQLRLIVKNCYRFINNPLRLDYEPLFSSAYERFKLLKLLESSKLLSTNFIYRHGYRANANTVQLRKKTMQEYYNNIKSSDYILCIRGSGNFSVRLYETLMMGRIPVFIDTDCIMPLADKINWKEHVVWIPWNDRKQIDKKIIEFHERLQDDEFISLQKSNRVLWENELSIAGVLNYINEITFLK